MERPKTISHVVQIGLSVGPLSEVQENLVAGLRHYIANKFSVVIGRADAETATKLLDMFYEMFPEEKEKMERLNREVFGGDQNSKNS